MRIHDKDFHTFISEAKLDAIVKRLAAQISADYSGRDLVVCPVLTGAFIFAADLVRHITLPLEVSGVRYASYSGLNSTGKVVCRLPFPDYIAGRDVLIVEDVIDSGLSMQTVLRDAKALKPASVKVCTLFFKPDAFRGDYHVDYVGRTIGNEFIVGYGLDYDELGRNIPSVLVIDD